MKPEYYRFQEKEFQPRMNTNEHQSPSCLDDPLVFHPLLLFVNIRVHSWLKFFFLNAIAFRVLRNCVRQSIEQPRRRR